MTNTAQRSLRGRARPGGHERSAQVAPSFVIMWGRHKGRTLGSLSDSDLQWYAEQYRGKDATLQACARAVWDAREVETGEDFGEADCAGNPSHYG